MRLEWGQFGESQGDKLDPLSVEVTVAVLEQGQQFLVAQDQELLFEALLGQQVLTQIPDQVDGAEVAVDEFSRDVDLLLDVVQGEKNRCKAEDRSDQEAGNDLLADRQAFADP